MSVEFVDTNVLVYAHSAAGGVKHGQAVGLLRRLLEERSGAVSIQVLVEFYAAATRKMGMTSQGAESVLEDFAAWIIHRQEHATLIRAARLQRRHRLSWWDALVVTSALDLGSSVLWTEELSDGQRFGSLRVRNPFRQHGA